MWEMLFHKQRNLSGFLFVSNKDMVQGSNNYEQNQIRLWDWLWGEIGMKINVMIPQVRKIYFLWNNLGTLAILDEEVNRSTIWL